MTVPAVLKFAENNSHQAATKKHNAAPKTKNVSEIALGKMRDILLHRECRATRYGSFAILTTANINFIFTWSEMPDISTLVILYLSVSQQSLTLRSESAT